MSAALLDDIGTKLEQRRATRQAEAIAQFNDLVTRFAAADEVDVAADEVEAVLEASGKSLTDLRAAIDRMVQRREALETYAGFRAAVEELTGAERALADLDREKRKWLDEYAVRARAARNLVSASQAKVRQAAEAKKVLLETADPELLARYERHSAEMRTEAQRLEAEISALRQQVDTAEKEYRAQFAKHSGHYVNWPGLTDDEHPRAGESLIEARARAASAKRYKAAQDEAARQGVTREGWDRFIEEFIAGERERFVREFTAAARSKLTALEEKLAASVTAAEALSRGREFVRRQFEEQALAP